MDTAMGVVLFFCFFVFFCSPWAYGAVLYVGSMSVSLSVRWFGGR